MTTLVQKARQHFKRYVKKWNAESSARRFMNYCREKWPQDRAPQGDMVVLLGLFPHKIATYCNLHMANDLARRTGGRVEAFKLTPGRQLVEDIYAASGAPVGLDASYAEDTLPELAKQADALFAALRTKWDLLALRYDGLKIGDAIYDSYLRYHAEPTVVLDDPRLREIIYQALIVYVAATNYLKVRKVVGFIADDFSYHECGVITRVMMRAGVPSYIVCYGPEHFLYPLTMEPETGNADYPIRWPFHHYRTIFRSMPEEEQVRCREKGRQHLEKKLSGHLDRFTLVNITAFGETKEKVFVDSGKPRIVILMHDFFDSPHGYRSMLFPDFHEWATFLFTEASKTDFEWYMKPHPGCYDFANGRLNADNYEPFNVLQKRFPKIKLLHPTVSNRQIVAEGISAMFTMYGTAGHEFARMGVPVVNAGDNPHIAYDFNYHPSSVAEYADFIARADRLTCTANHDDIAEYVYMNYYYFRDHGSTGANPLPPEFYADPGYEAACAGPLGYDKLIFPHDPAREAEMKKYYDQYFRDHPQNQARA